MSRLRDMGRAEILTDAIAALAIALATQFAVVPSICVEVRTRRILALCLVVALASTLRGYGLRRMCRAVPPVQAGG